MEGDTLERKIDTLGIRSLVQLTPNIHRSFEFVWEISRMVQNFTKLKLLSQV